MPDNNEIEENPKAISSWNGFVYQGKIALYIALKTIQEHYQTVKSDRNIILFIEQYEDIALKQDDTFLSLHQVKCKSTSNLGSYNDAIQSLVQKVATTNCRSFLHVSVELDNEPQETNVSLFEYYENKKYLGINEVQDHIQELISQIRESEQVEPLTPSAMEVLIFALYEKINELVAEIHFSSQALGEEIDELPREIRVHTIYEKILSFSNDIQKDEIFYIAKIKSYISEKFDDYLSSKRNLTEEKKILLSKIMTQINNFTKEKFYIFLKTINPFWYHERIDSTDSFAEAIPQSLINPYLNFLDATIELPGILCPSKHRYELSRGKDIYTAISINDDILNPEITAFQLQKALSKNDQFIKLLYQGDKLISKEISNECILTFINSNTDSSFKYLNTNDFTSPMQVPLINLREVLVLLGVQLA